MTSSPRRISGSAEMNRQSYLIDRQRPKSREQRVMILNLAKAVRRSTRGSSTTEYAAMVAFVGAGAMGAVYIAGGDGAISRLFDFQAQQMAAGTGSGGGAPKIPGSPDQGEDTGSERDPSIGEPSPQPKPPAGEDDWGIGPFGYPDTYLDWDERRVSIVSEYRAVPGLNDRILPFTVWSSDGGPSGLALDNVEGGSPAPSGEMSRGTRLNVDIPPVGQSLVVHLRVGDETGSWRLIRSDAPDIQPFGFPDTWVPWDSQAERVSSEYVDILGLEDQPYDFITSTSRSGATPLAMRNVEGGQPAASGQLTHGTFLNVETPPRGEETLVSLEIEGEAGTWRVIREPAPEIEPFGFRTTVLGWDEPVERAASEYVDIRGLEHEPYPFTTRTQTGAGNAHAERNVVAGAPAASGDLVHGTNLTVDAPGQGQTQIVYLTVGDETGLWRVLRETGPSSECSEHATRAAQHSDDEHLQQYEECVAQERAEQERLEEEARQKAEQERLEEEARQKAEEERLEEEARQKAEQERLLQEAEDHCEADRLKAEKNAKFRNKYEQCIDDYLDDPAKFGGRPHDGNNGHGNESDGNDDSNPGKSNDPNDHTDEDGAPGGKA